ncbi:MAG: hypothetical protein M3O36_07400, partial [Myxococcota bacterium]|nr:hypothetical protein [Myxococcota bacterium]
PGRWAVAVTLVAGALAALVAAVGRTETREETPRATPAPTWVSETPDRPVGAPADRAADPVVVVVPAPQLLAPAPAGRRDAPSRPAISPSDARYPDLASKSDRCRVPYELDADGHRHYTRACLQGD